MPNELDNKQIEGLKRLLSLLDNDALTKENFKESFQSVIDFIKKIEAKNIEEFKAIRQVLTDFAGKIKDDTGTDFEGLKAEVNGLVNDRMAKIMSEHERRMGAVDKRIASLRDGEDADESRVAENAATIALERLKPLFMAIDSVPAELPKYGTNIRDALELLNGDDRLRIETIAGLQEALEGLRSRKVGGGFSKIAMDSHIIDDQTPSGTKNGVNTDFTTAGIPNPDTSLKVYVNGQRMRITEDYTLSKNTITFLVAPAATDIILCDYRT